MRSRANLRRVDKDQPPANVSRCVQRGACVELDSLHQLAGIDRAVQDPKGQLVRIGLDARDVAFQELLTPVLALELTGINLEPALDLLVAVR